jgi:hypothetical protein
MEKVNAFDPDLYSKKECLVRVFTHSYCDLNMLSYS